jgi:hypothetical protein
MYKRPSTQLVGHTVHRRLPTFSTAIAGLAIAALAVSACTSVAGAVNKPTALHSRDFAKNHRVPVTAPAIGQVVIDQTQDSLRKEHLGIDPSYAGAPSAKGSLYKGQLRRTAPVADQASATFMDPALQAQRRGERSVQSLASATFMDPALQAQRRGERSVQSLASATFKDPALQAQRRGERSVQSAASATFMDPALEAQRRGERSVQSLASATSPAFVDDTTDSLRKEHLYIAPVAAPTTAGPFVDDTTDSLRKEHLYIAQ